MNSWRFPPPKIHLLLFAGERKHFTHPVETYQEWALLGAERGSFRFSLGEAEPEFCREGDFVLCPPGLPFHREAEEIMDFIFIRFQWNPLSPQLWSGRRILRNAERYASTASALKDIFNGQDGPISTAWANHLLEDFLRQLAFERQSGGPNRAPDRLMLKAAAELRNGLAENCNLQELAKKLGVSPSQFSRRFHAAHGVSPAIYRTMLRVKHARKLLLETNWTTDRIANACGFDNAFYFSRIFKEHGGQAPTEFRRRNQV